jgi:hypothetical protein
MASPFILRREPRETIRHDMRVSQKKKKAVVAKSAYRKDIKKLDCVLDKVYKRGMMRKLAAQAKGKKALKAWRKGLNRNLLRNC